MDMARVMQRMISMSLITVFLSYLSLSLTLWTYCGATTPKHCKDVCEEKAKVDGGISLACKRVCTDGVVTPPKDEFKKHMENVVVGKIEEGDSGSAPIQGHNKCQKLEAAEKFCNYELLQNSGKRGLFKTEASGDLAVNVRLEITNDGEYILRMKKTVPSSTEEDELKRAKQMAQNAAMLSFYGEMLQDVGEKLHAQSRALLRSIFEVPAPYYSKSD